MQTEGAGEGGAAALEEDRGKPKALGAKRQWMEGQRIGSGRVS